jgi:hypothetical protein
MPIKSSTTAINSSHNIKEEKIANKRATDPFDQFIFE